MSDQPAGERELLESELEIARYHREHERFHATRAYEQATEIRRHAGALKHLADRWLQTEAESPERSYDDPRLRAAGCSDLNDPAALATGGILFMEGESEPAELTEMKARLDDLATRLAEYSSWLAEKMDAAWSRESVLLTPALADLAYPRHLVLMRTTTHGHQTGVAARLVRAAVTALGSRSYEPANVRADTRGNSRVMRSAAWLLDAAGAMLAEQAAELSLSDPDWAEFIERAEVRLAA
jgi:hypothetical protein